MNQFCGSGKRYECVYCQPAVLYQVLDISISRALRCGEDIATQGSSCKCFFCGLVFSTYTGYDTIRRLLAGA